MSNTTIKVAVIIVLTGLMTLTLAACGSFTGTEGDPSKASVGITYTHDYKDKTIIQWLDENQNVVGESKYPYSSAMVSMENANVENDRICIAPNGPFGKRDENKVAVIDTTDGSYKEIELTTDNHVSCNNEGDLMVVSGNGNGEGYIDLIDLRTDEVQNYTDSKLWEDGIMQVILINGIVYGSGGGAEKSGIYKIDAKNKKCELIYSCKDDPQVHCPTYLCRHNDDLVFLDDNRLMKYDTKSGNMDSFALSRDAHDIVNISGDKVWLGYTDQNASEYDSLLEVREYDSGSIIDKIDVDGAIWQIALSGDSAYLLLGDDDMAKSYQLDNNQIKFLADIQLDSKYKDYTYGGIYALGR